MYCVTVKPRNWGVQSDRERRELGILDQLSRSRLGLIKRAVNIFASQKLNTFVGKYRLLVRYIYHLWMLGGRGAGLTAPSHLHERRRWQFPWFARGFHQIKLKLVDPLGTTGLDTSLAGRSIRFVTDQPSSCRSRGRAKEPFYLSTTVVNRSSEHHHSSERSQLCVPHSVPRYIFSTTL